MKIQAYHGTVRSINGNLDTSAACSDSDLGPGLYFSSDYEDSYMNYACREGADVQGKIFRLAEELADEKDCSWDEAVELVTTEFVENEGVVYTVDLSPKKPLVISHKKNEGSRIVCQTFDEEIEEFEDTKEFVYLYYFLDQYGVAESILDFIYDDDDGNFSLLFSDLFKAIKSSDVFLYEDQDAHRRFNFEVLFGYLGYDLIIDKTVWSKFEMDYTDGNTIHYIALDQSILSIVEIDQL